MPVWLTIALTVLSLWVLAAIVLAVAIGRAIRLADRRTRHRHRSTEHVRRAAHRR